MIKIQVVNLYVRFARPQECERYVAIIVKLMPYFGKFCIFRRKNIIILSGYNTCCWFIDPGCFD